MYLCVKTSRLRLPGARIIILKEYIVEAVDQKPRYEAKACKHKDPTLCAHGSVLLVVIINRIIDHTLDLASVPGVSHDQYVHYKE